MNFDVFTTERQLRDGRRPSWSVNVTAEGISAHAELHKYSAQTVITITPRQRTNGMLTMAGKPPCQHLRNTKTKTHQRAYFIQRINICTFVVKSGAMWGFFLTFAC
jgi:hypothetical protein